MKRNYPYTGQGAQQQAYGGQPPPPAGPAPPLPLSGPPPPPAYANYGYGSVRPGRNAAAAAAAAPMNGAGAASPRQPQWNQQQWQQQPHYAPPIQPQPMHSGPYRGQNAAHSSHNQAAAYSPHTQQQQQQPAQYPYQASAPAMHSPSPAPPSYGYSPSAPQHQNLAANNGNAQNWPGAYAAGSQAGPPSKKARYQASAAPAPVPPYGAPGVAPVAPMGGNMAGGAPGPYGPGAANPPPPPPQQQPYAWQAPMSAPVAPHMSPQPGQQGKFGRLTSGSAGRGGLSAQSARGGKNGRGAGGVGVGVGVGNGPGRGMNRNGAQNRGNLSQGPSGGQRAALPANPNASMNPQRAQNGPASAWGPCANAPSAAAAAPSGPAGQSAGAGRRASTASSVHSDKNGRRAGGPSVNGAGSVTKPGFSSQNMIPIDAPRGPNVARNKAGKGDKDASSSARKGTNASADNANNATAARSSAVDANASAKDSSHGASSKRAHTDFRILELEIKELDWSWFGSKALSKSAQAADGGEGEVKHEPGREVAEPNEAAADAASQAGDNDESSGGADPQAEGDERAADLDEAQTTRNDVHNDEENQNQNADPTVEAEPDSNENNNHDDEEAGYDEHELDAEGKANDDAEAEADDDADGEADADADKDLDADANDDAEPEADADAAEDQPEANGDENVSMSHVETDTVASNAAHSVAPTPEPSSELTNGKQAVQATKGFKADRAKMMANLRDSTKLRFCFAAMSNAGPEGAPTGPKADQVQEATEVASTDFKVKTEDIAEGAEAQTEPEDEDRTAEDPAAVEAETGPEAEAEAEKPANEDAATVGEVKVDAEASAPDAAAKDEETLEEQPVMDPAADSTDKNEGAKHEEDNKEKVPAAESSNEAKQSDQPAITASSKGKKPKSAAESVPQAKGPPQLSLNRIFLSFAANRKRLAIDAEAIKSVKIHRSEHWVEIVIDTSRQTASAGRKKGEEYLVCNGTLLEQRAKGQENYTAVTRNEIATAWSSQTETESSDTKQPSEAEHLELPPFFRLPSSSDLTILVRLDPTAPLPEPTWLRKNDLAPFLASLQRGSAAVSGRSETAVSVGTAQHVWAGKIEVLDPDPPPSMQTRLYEWVKESFVGSQRERRRWVDQLLCTSKIKTEGEGEHGEKERDILMARSFIEIVARLVKGERVAAPSPSSGGFFANAAATTSLTTTATYPGWVMLSLLNILLDRSTSAAEVREVKEKMDKICMEIPSSTLFKAIDLTFKDTTEAGRKSNAEGTGQGGAGGAGGGGQRMNAGGNGIVKAGVKRSFAGQHNKGGGRFGKRKRA